MALPNPEPPQRGNPPSELAWALYQTWYCPRCGGFHPAGEVRPARIIAFVPLSRWSLMLPGTRDNRWHTDLWATACPTCGEEVRLLNPLNPLLVDYRQRRIANGYIGAAGVLLNMPLICAFPPGIVFVMLAVLICWAVVCLTAPKAPWWAS